MTGRYKSFEYEITTDSEFLNVKFGIPPELFRQLQSLYYEAQKGGNSVVEKLNRLIGKYPQVPHLKNFLSAAYLNSGNSEKAREVNHLILQEHPDYLFGKLNLGYEYYHKKQYEKIPEILGNLMEIQDLYPERTCFHLSEVTGFNKLAIMYFCAIGNLPAAESRYEIMEEMAPDHPDIKEVFPYLMKARLEAAQKRMQEEERTSIRVEPNPFRETIRVETKPEFNNPEIDWLYENDLTIDKEKLKALLNLPHDSLVSDLRLVLKDAIYRYKYFRNLANKSKEWPEQLLSFPVHAVYLLGELKATAALNNILETFSQGEEFIEFWYGDFMTGSLWEPLYYIADKQLDVLKKFVLSPGIWTYARSEIAACVKQVAFHQPDRKNVVTLWFSEVFRFIAGASLEDNIIDSDFLGLTIWDGLEIRDPALLPVMKKLFNLGYVNTGICGDYKDIERDINKPISNHSKKQLLNIYTRYDQINASWAGNKENDNSTYEREKLFRAGPKIGRNDPCSCGSGKKYKKCCFGK